MNNNNNKKQQEITNNQNLKKSCLFRNMRFACFFIKDLFSDKEIYKCRINVYINVWIFKRVFLRVPFYKWKYSAPSWSSSSSSDVVIVDDYWFIHIFEKELRKNEEDDI